MIANNFLAPIQSTVTKRGQSYSMCPLGHMGWAD